MANGGGFGSQLDVQVAKPVKYGELPAALGSIGVWVYLAVTGDGTDALGGSPLLLLGLMLGGWTVLMRLRFGPQHLALVIGPWRRWVDLNALENVSWKMTGGWMSQGTLFVSDIHGHRVPIYVGRFTRADEWGRLLLSAADRVGAAVDPRARRLLDETPPAIRAA